MNADPTDGLAKCKVCNTANLPDSSFCRGCGVRIEGQSQLIDQVRLIIKNELKDQKVVELETAQLIASRVSDWVKLVGIFAAAPLALLLATLTVWGITKFVDVNDKLKLAQDKASGLDATSGALRSRYTNLQKDLAGYESLEKDVKQNLATIDAVSKQVQSIQSNVSAINKRLGFAPSAYLSPDLQRQLESQVRTYEVFLEHLGYSIGNQRVTVSVVDNLPGNMASIYDPNKHKLEVIKESAATEGCILTEYTPIVLRARMGEDDSTSYDSVMFGLERYLPASFFGRSVCGRTTESGPEKWPEIKAGTDVNLDEHAQVLVKALWTLRNYMPPGVLDRAVLKAWVSTQDKNQLPTYHREFCGELLKNLPLAQRESASRELATRDLL
ncbi:hypothetical protein EDE15_5105 [Edaphobacter aggregans]|uniref:Uncharacterized protein n=1 Tax=Edaphobacter aggregans TaxID=570835 RepID=A0A428MRD8_9BACT|nr:hypothetical protein [Edaphobacter aggregans]RSL19436.1 hypothetical protein EDE15_5105 [Edaphobacter aggregans]